MPSTSQPKNTPIYFYSPCFPDNPAQLPDNVVDSWAWFYEVARPKLGLGDGEYAWVFQTYLYLKNVISCIPTNVMPRSGIVLAHRSSIPFDLIPGAQLVLICLQADKSPHPFAQLSVVLTEASRYMRWTHLGDYHRPKVLWQKKRPNPNCVYIRHWPVPGLKPRLHNRRHRVENVAYLGVAHSLAAELRQPQWREDLQKLGFSWYWRNGKHLSDWNDFQEIDVIVSIRNFDDQQPGWASKPPTKLINAWHAGCFAIMGCEASLKEVRQSEYDYIEVQSYDEILTGLQRLRDDESLRQKMLDNGEVRAKANSIESICRDWEQFLNSAQNYYDRWTQKSRFERYLFWLGRYFNLLIDRVQRFLYFRREGIQKRLQKLR